MSNRAKQEEFLQVLNLVAARNVKIKYCRTIKERLRAKTQDESLALPSQHKFKSPMKKKSDDLKTGSLSPVKQAKVDVEEGLDNSYIKSYKNRKKTRKKSFSSIVSPPSSKSLLRLVTESIHGLDIKRSNFSYSQLSSSEAEGGLD